MKKEKKLLLLYLFQAIGDLFIFGSAIASSYLINLHFNKSVLNVLWVILFMSLWIYSKHKIEAIEK